MVKVVVKAVVEKVVVVKAVVEKVVVVKVVVEKVVGGWCGGESGCGG